MQGAHVLHNHSEPVRPTADCCCTGEGLRPLRFARTVDEEKGHIRAAVRKSKHFGLFPRP
jgi:hypothetical protein